LIGSTKTKEGLTIKTSVDTNEYAKGIKITDAEIESLSLERKKFMANGTTRYIHKKLLMLFCNAS